MDLHSILKTFKNSTQFYNEKLQGVNHFDNVPFTTKAELIDSQMKYQPYGIFTDDSKEIKQTYRTSGTTNNPLLLSFTQNDIDYITDIGADCFKHSGMGKYGNNEVVINCLNLSMWAGGFLDAQAMMKTGVQCVNFGTGNTIELIKLIINYSKKYKTSLHCTPSYLPIIQEKLKNDFNLEPRDLKLHALYLGAEGGVQNNEYRNGLISGWNAHVFNANYGMSEVCSIMASADEDNILKFSNQFLSNYYLELIEKNDNCLSFDKITEGREGILVATSLKKESQPLLRYNTKEKIRIKKIAGEDIYFEIVGRSDDMIVFKGVNFFPEQLRDIILSFDELSGNYQIQAKKSNDLVEEMNLICELSSNKNIDESKLRNKLSTRIRNELTLKFQVNFVYKFETRGNKHKIIEFI